MNWATITPFKKNTETDLGNRIMESMYPGLMMRRSQPTYDQARMRDKIDMFIYNEVCFKTTNVNIRPYSEHSSFTVEEDHEFLRQWFYDNLTNDEKENIQKEIKEKVELDRHCHSEEYIDELIREFSSEHSGKSKKKNKKTKKHAKI
jgi:hypothetical protein